MQILYFNAYASFGFYLFLFLLTSLSTATTMSLEQALLVDIMPATGTQCSTGTGLGPTSTSFTFEFTSTQAVSAWDETLGLPFEESVFLAELSHVDANVNKSWSIRVAQGIILKYRILLMLF
jgi:hypothetical protein